MGTREEVDQKLNALSLPIQNAYKNESGQWVLGEPKEKEIVIERKEVWQNTDGKWYFLERRPKYGCSLSNLTGADITIIETNDTGLERDAVFEKIIVNPGIWDVKNTTEATDLNV